MQNLFKTRSELDSILCLIQLKGRSDFLQSQLLKERLSFPTIESHYKDMLEKMQIAYRKHPILIDVLEYYNSSCYEQSEYIIPVYSQQYNGYFIKTHEKKMSLPTKYCLSAAIDLEERVNYFRLLTFKYYNNLEIIGSKQFEITTKEVYPNIENIWEDDDPIYCYCLGTNYLDQKRYFALFNRNLIPKGKELHIMIPNNLYAFFLGIQGKNVKKMAKDLGVPFIYVNK